MLLLQEGAVGFDLRSLWEQMSPWLRYGIPLLLLIGIVLFFSRKRLT